MMGAPEPLVLPLPLLLVQVPRLRGRGLGMAPLADFHDVSGVGDKGSLPGLPGMVLADYVVPLGVSSLAAYPADPGLAVQARPLPAGPPREEGAFRGLIGLGPNFFELSGRGVQLGDLFCDVSDTSGYRRCCHDEGRSQCDSLYEAHAITAVLRCARLSARSP